MTSHQNHSSPVALQKHIGVKELFAYYISSVVGVGVLIIPGVAAQIAGPASLIAWFLLALISAPVAITFAKMAIVVPDSGGVPAFIEKMFDSTVGKSMAILLTLTMVIGNPVMGLASAHYLRELIGYDDSLVPWVGYAFMLLSIIFNLMGVRLGSKLQSYALFFLIAGLTIVILLSLPKSNIENVTPFFPNGYMSVGSAMVVCFFSFLGWENVSSISEEVKDPERSFHKTIPWAVLCVGGLYTLITWVYLSVVPAELRSSDPTVLSPILKAVFGNGVAAVGAWVAILLLILATNSWVLGASRQTFSLARNGVLPRSLAHLSTSSGVPTHALLFLALGYGLITLLIFKAGWSEEWLIKLANSNFMVIYFVAFAVGLRVFKSKRMKICSWIAIIATVSFVPFLGWMILFSLSITIASYLWVHYKSKKDDFNY